MTWEISANTFKHKTSDSPRLLLTDKAQGLSIDYTWHEGVRELQSLVLKQSSNAKLQLNTLTPRLTTGFKVLVQKSEDGRRWEWPNLYLYSRFQQQVINKFMTGLLHLPPELALTLESCMQARNLHIAEHQFLENLAILDEANFQESLDLAIRIQRSFVKASATPIQYTADIFFRLANACHVQKLHRQLAMVCTTFFTQFQPDALNKQSIYTASLKQLLAEAEAEIRKQSAYVDSNRDPRLKRKRAEDLPSMLPPILPRMSQAATECHETETKDHQNEAGTHFSKGFQIPILPRIDFKEESITEPAAKIAPTDTDSADITIPSDLELTAVRQTLAGLMSQLQSLQAPPSALATSHNGSSHLEADTRFHSTAELSHESLRYTLTQLGLRPAPNLSLAALSTQLCRQHAILLAENKQLKAEPHHQEHAPSSITTGLKRLPPIYP